MHNITRKATRAWALSALAIALASCTLFELGSPTDPSTTTAATPDIDATRNAQFAALSIVDAAQIISTTTPPPAAPAESTPAPEPTATGQTLNVFVTPIEAVEVEADE